MIPIEDHKWTPICGMELPEGHKSDFTLSADGTVIVRISGPNAHVTGSSKEIEEAVQAAFEWFEQVGSYL